MPRNFTVKDGFRPKVAGHYPWPCEPLPNRTIELFTSDVLTKRPDGSWFKHTGLGCSNIQLTDEQVEPWPSPVELTMTHL